jgi:hypothetical protein
MSCRWLILLTSAIACSSVALAADAPTKPVSFRDQVAPILVKNCLGCHNAKKAEGGLNMTTFALFKKGGKGVGTEILEPGDPEASELIDAVGPEAEPRMPYKLPPLSARAIRTLETWVKQGAKFDGPSETETPIASLVDPLRDLPKVVLKAPAADPVTSLAYSHDGATLAAAVGRKVILFDASTGKPRTTLADHPGPVISVRFTPDGSKLVASGGRAGMFGAVSVWDVSKGQRLAESRGHSDSILAAELSPDGTLLATAGYDRVVLLWDLATLKPVKTLKDHTDAVYALAFAPDGKTLASAGADRTVKLWDLASGRRTKTFSDATAELYALVFAADGATVLAAGVDRSIRAWRVAATEEPLVNSAFAHDAAVLRLVASADGKTLVSSGEDNDVKLWDLATLTPRAALAEQPDWPLAVALSRDGKRLAVGRYDGSLTVYDSATGKVALTAQTAPVATPAAPPKPELVRNATLNPPAPRAAARGGKTRITLSGNSVGRATEVVFSEPGLTASIVKAEKPDPNRLEADLTIAPDARLGLHRIGVVTPLGVPGFQSFAVEAQPSSPEAEPNDDPSALKPIPLPATLVGTIDRPGDLDHVRFEAKQGRQLVFAMTAKTLGSGLNGVLALLDDKGRTLAEATVGEGTNDPVLTATIPRDGVFTLRISDADYGGSGNHFYRIAAGAEPYLASIYPLGVARGGTTTVHVSGVNLQGKTDVEMAVPPGTGPVELREIATLFPGETRPINRRMVVVADGPQTVEVEPNDEPAKAKEVATPGGVSGRISRDGDLDHYRFVAKKGERLIVEVFGRRLGTPLDPVIEILDAKGRPVPRAVLKPMAETEVAFRDHNSSGTGIRLTKWNNLAMNDTVLIGREVTRIFALPKNPDDDCQFWGEQGQRIGLLETTPEHHPMAQPIYKVEVHPPGATFPPGGMAPVTLDYRNDDGGPSFNKDSRLTFDPPADATYIVRVADVRGLGGESWGYHLVVRRPRPDFQVTVSPENPSIPRGGTTLVTATVARRDGFDAPVDVSALNLPPGVTATPARIERETTTAVLALTADLAAPAFSPPSWTLSARGEDIQHDVDPGGARGGWVTVIPAPNLKVVPTPTRISIRPGQEVTMTLAVERAPAFSGRVPIDVRNLPQGVRVQNIGLNGVLVTEKQTSRTVSLYAEPWVDAMERPFYAVGKAESAGTEHSSTPIILVVEPATDSTKPRSQPVSARVDPK